MVIWGVLISVGGREYPSRGIDPPGQEVFKYLLTLNWRLPVCHCACPLPMDADLRLTISAVLVKGAIKGFKIVLHQQNYKHFFCSFFASLMPFKRHKRAISTKRQKTNCLCYAQSAFFSKSFFTFLRLKKTVKTQLPFKSDIIFFFRMASYVF